MRTWENNVRKVVPYVPGEQPQRDKLIKLNTNENPYPPAPGVLQVLKEFQVDRLRKYPDPAIGKLVQAIADNYQVKKEQVFVGVGSDDVLAMIFMTFFNGEQPILFPDITYSFYEVWADMLRIPYVRVPLNEELCIVPENYIQPNSGIIFPNPNAPTGELLGLDAVELIIKNNPASIVVVDEAYIDFGGKSALPLVEKYDNVIVVYTFSKSRSMAGSRIGFAISNEKVIGYLNDVKYSFNSYTMDAITIDLGVAAISDQEYFEKTRAQIIATREWTKAKLQELGFVFGDSMSNFIFATHPDISMVELYQALKEADIYVRYFGKPDRISNYLRISIGTEEEMQELIHFLTNWLYQNGKNVI